MSSSSDLLQNIQEAIELDIRRSVLRDSAAVEYLRAQVPEPSLMAQLTAMHELAYACMALFIN